MALKKSDIYSSLWAGCNELRGGMDASQYKDYVLFLLFVKYISDKYEGQKYAPIKIPRGASFKDMVALKGKPDIGDRINKKIVAPLGRANKLDNMPDFNDDHKLGSGKEMVNRLTNLISIFEDKRLDFKNNRAEGDDILGDAYEYLMRHFATESGKSKGQFYTPAEVSRILAKVIGIDKAKVKGGTTVYDPTCGSGSLLLKVATETNAKVSLYGQEKDSATSTLAKMNMILHDNPTAEILQGNTIAHPKFKDGNSLKLFDYVVANPPFSDKSWSTGINPENDEFERFGYFGTPPNKQGDYAYLLHILKSLKSRGSGACILPHGVLFRGNAELGIRKNLIKKRYIKGIIGLPSNLFYGTGIPACIIVLDKKGAKERKGIFMVDASKGFIKDGNKNRLREMDIHKIVDSFNGQYENPKYSRLVSYKEIEKNGYNLNLPRYIDGYEEEDIQDIDAHLNGGIPERDINALGSYWKTFPSLKKRLFKHNRKGYLDLAIDKSSIRDTVARHKDFIDFKNGILGLHQDWEKKTKTYLKKLTKGCPPKDVIHKVSEGILEHYKNAPLVNNYNVYQHLMDYWLQTMQDDLYIISLEGWNATPRPIIEKDKKGKEKNKGWECDLLPKNLIIDRFFSEEKEKLQDLHSGLENIDNERNSSEEEHGHEEGIFFELEKINKNSVKSLSKEIENDPDQKNDYKILTKWLDLSESESKFKKRIKEEESALDKMAYERYSTLSENQVKGLVIENKWLGSIRKDTLKELERVAQNVSTRVKELGERYETPLPAQLETIEKLENKVNSHLGMMGFSW